jgi:hypothetical protein
MAEKTLVARALTPDMIDAGEKFVDTLKRNRYSLRAAFWMINPPDESWRLILASDEVNSVGRLKAYERALKWAPSMPRLYWPALVSVEEPNDVVVKNILDALHDNLGPRVGETALNLYTSTFEPTRLYIYEA